MITQLVKLFEEDERLRLTIPKSYHLDEEKVKLWNELNDFQSDNIMKIVKVSFFDWQQAFAKCVEHILDELQTKDFIMSTGVTTGIKQSVSEIWTFYIAKKLLQLNNVKFEELDKAWVKISLPNRKENKRVDILFVDDFINTGWHMSQRVCSSCKDWPESVKAKSDIRVLVCVAVIPKDCKWQSPFEDAEVEHGVKLMDRIDIFGGLNIEVPCGHRLFFDHKSLEELYDDLYAGFLGKRGCLGSLIYGVDPLSIHQQPPALYHLVFGSGELPITTNPLMPTDIPGFYKSLKFYL